MSDTGGGGLHTKDRKRRPAPSVVSRSLKTGRIPFRVQAMLATLVREPFHKPGWVYEEKYDGYRILAYKEGERVHHLTEDGGEAADEERKFGEYKPTNVPLPAIEVEERIKRGWPHSTTDAIHDAIPTEEGLAGS